MSFRLASAARATIGGRSGQEDAFRLWPADGAVRVSSGNGLLAVLADGMGGHKGGAVAGQTACATFADVFAAASDPYDRRLAAALDASNQALARGVEENAALRGMGCTLIAAWFDEGGIRWTSVGDSLLLLYRFPDVIRLNADHSLGAFLDEQARQHRITPREAKGNPNRNALRSALTGSKIDLVDLRAEPLQLRPGDWIVLASDGIASLAGDEMADIIYRHHQAAPEAMADGLIAGVLAKGLADQDNTTVVAVCIEGESAAAMDDITTRVMRPPAPREDPELRTRRIGVTRPKSLPAGRSRRAASYLPAGGVSQVPATVWVIAAAALLLFAAALLLRSLPSTAPESQTKAIETPAPDLGARPTAPVRQGIPAVAPGLPEPRRPVTAEGDDLRPEGRKDEAGSAASPARPDAEPRPAPNPSTRDPNTRGRQAR